LDAFDVAAALAVYRDRFGDAGDFVFVLAGDFNPDDVVDLVAGYLGTLPATGRADGFVDRQPDPPQGAVVETVHAGTDEQAAVSFLVTGALDAGSEDRIHAQLLQLVLDTRLRNRLREALSATYSPQVEVSTTDEPDALIETYIEVSGSPDRLDEISQETVAVLRDLAANGPTEAELATARQQLTRQFEFVSNEFWIETLLFYANHPDESLDDVGRRIATVEETTTADLQDLAAIAFPDGRYVEVRQLPAQ
jgi:zinc protease